MKKRIIIVLALALAFGAGYAFKAVISGKAENKPLKRVNDYFGAKYATHFGVNYASDSGAKYATFLE